MKLLAVKVVPMAPRPTGVGLSPQVDSQDGAAWWCNCYELHNQSYGGHIDRFITSTRATNYTGQTITLSLSETHSVGNTWSANVGVTADVVTAGVGFDVTVSYDHTFSTSAPVPPGQTIEIDAYTGLERTNYDVYVNPWIGDTYYAGSGNADQRTGDEFAVWQVS